MADTVPQEHMETFCIGRIVHSLAVVEINTRFIHFRRMLGFDKNFLDRG
jgi:hypothetical protein